MPSVSVSQPAGNWGCECDVRWGCWSMVCDDGCCRESTLRMFIRFCWCDKFSKICITSISLRESSLFWMLSRMSFYKRSWLQASAILKWCLPWSMNSISISGMLPPSHILGQKVKSRWPPMKGNFVRHFQFSLRSCTSVPVLYMTSVISFCLARLQNISNHGKSVQDEVLLDQFYLIEYSKRFKNALWPKKCVKLYRHGRLTVKTGLALGSFLK